jgi:hypothetical protein
VLLSFSFLEYNKIMYMTLRIKNLSYLNKGINIFFSSFFFPIIVGLVEGRNVMYHLICYF